MSDEGSKAAILHRGPSLLDAHSSHLTKESALVPHVLLVLLAILSLIVVILPIVSFKNAADCLFIANLRGV